MLKRLEIQNYAIIESLELDLDKGLSIITGETGAGKSILLGALGLIMGKRADTKVLYEEDKKCIVEAVFDISSYGLKDLFESEDLDYEAETIIRRVISTNGKSRAFINDEPTTLQTLKAFSNNLVDLHQQFDTLDLHSISFQTKTIDALAKNLQLVEKYRHLYNTYVGYKKELNALLEKQNNANKELDFLSFQMKEFDDAELINGEQKESEMILERLTSSEDIKRVCLSLSHMLEEGENNMIDILQEGIKELSNIKDKDPRLEEVYDRIFSIQEDLRDISKTATDIGDDTEYDAERIEELTQRLDLIYKLQKKHNVNTLDELIKIQDQIGTQLQGYNDVSSEIEQLQTSIEKAKNQLIEQAQKISKNRKKVAPKFEKTIHEMLVPLSMENAYIKVEMEEMVEPGPSGMDKLTFLFSSNKGSAFKPLKDVASGGEISRLTLCIKSLVAEAMTLPTLIFDEIDTGVSGEVASRMGDILKKLAADHQVISITHSPQIAARADTHYFVHKNDKQDRTVTALKELSNGERIVEIAKMLSGDPPTEAALENAKSLLMD